MQIRTIYRLLCWYEKDKSTRAQITSMLKEIVIGMFDIKESQIDRIKIYRTDDFGFQVNYDKDKFIQIKYYAAIKEVSINMNRNIIHLKENLWD